MKPTETSLIIGYGRLGQTLARLLEARFKVAIIEPDSRKQAKARARGYQVVDADDIGRFQTVFLCVPISRFEATLKVIAPKLAPDTLIIDTCSVKLYPVKVMQDVLPDDTRILATHPLFGPDSARQGAEGLSIVVCPVRLDKAVQEDWRQLWTRLGLKVIEATPDEHDRATAYTLGLTHFTGRILGELNLEQEAITTVGFEALLNVVEQTTNDSWQLFHDMQHYNPYSKEMRDRVFAAISDVERKLNEAIED